MEEDNHLNPLAPSAKYGKSDEEFGKIKPQIPPKSSSKCFVYALLLAVLLSIAFLIFGLSVLRIDSPTVRISRVSLNNLQYQTGSLNLTMVTEIRVRNRNFGAFQFGGGNTVLIYENASIGVGSIYGGRVGRREGRNVNVTVRVIPSSTYDLATINSTTNISRDAGSGLLNLKSYAELRGEVHVMKIMNRYRTAIMNCTMALNLTTQAVQYLFCS